MSKRSVTLKKYQKYLTGAVFQVCSKIFLQIVIIFFLFFSFAEFIFSKITCFQLFILGIQTTFRLEKPQCKNFWWEYIKNESRKSMFLVVSRSVFFRALLGVQVKKIGSVEINLSNSIL